MNRKLELKAFAKANLSLDITGTRGALHTLDSFMMSLDCFDALTVSERDDGEIAVKFVGAEIGEDNTAYKAAKKVQDIIGGNGWDIVVEKGIPMGAGLGGSSADGAAVLRALDVLYRLPARGVDMRALALDIGSDVPFMLTGGLARVGGVGEEMFFLENKYELFVVGIMSESVSTASAYRKFDEMYKDKKHRASDSDKLYELLLSGDKAALNHFGNALYEPVAALAPSVAKNYALLKKHCDCVNMTGSGGMVLGYFTDLVKFSECVSALRGKVDFKVFSPVKTGILHEWLQR